MWGVAGGNDAIKIIRRIVCSLHINSNSEWNSSEKKCSQNFPIFLFKNMFWSFFNFLKIPFYFFKKKKIFQIDLLSSHREKHWSIKINLNSNYLFCTDMKYTPETERRRKTNDVSHRIEYENGGNATHYTIVIEEITDITQRKKRKKT